MLNLIVIKTQQLEKLVLFYQLIGLSFVYHQHGNGPFHYSAELDQLVFELYPLPQTNTVDKSTRLGFKVFQLDALMLALENASIKILKKPQQTKWGYTAVVEDPDGRKIELTQIH